MNEQELKIQIDEINAQIDDGKTVEITVENENESAQLEYFKEGDRATAKKIASGDVPLGVNVNSIAPNLGDDAAGAFGLDLSADDDISDSEIVDKIANASGADSGDPSVPKVILTRDPANKVWVLVEKCSYSTAGHTITAPADYKTDLASVPRAFWAIIAPEELSLAAPLFHDLIYRCGGGKLPEDQINPFDNKVFTRRQTDDLFREIMKKAGIPRWKRTAAYFAVRSFGAFAWKG